MCTAIKFNDDQGNMFFGRNLDWSTGYGQGVVITPREYEYHSAFLGSMKPKAGAIIGMAVVENNIPLYFDCANEAGLAVAGLNFPGYAAYAPEPVDGRTNVAAYEFPLWLAMNFDSVDAAEEALRNTTIVAKPVSDKFPVSMLHFMIADKNRTIIVEHTENGLEIFPAVANTLTNQPGYAWHRENLRSYMNIAPVTLERVVWGKNTQAQGDSNTAQPTAILTPFGTGSLMRGLPGDYYSPSRFVRAAYLNTHYPVKSTESDNVARLFHTLSGVAMIEGAGAMQGGDFEITVYTGGYSAATGTYYFSTYESPTIQSVQFSDHDLNTKDIIKEN